MNQIKTIQDNLYFNDWVALGKEIQRLNASSIFVLVDENTEKYCLFHILDHIDQPVKIIRINSGELNKSLDSCQRVWQFLLDKGADRHSLLINLGGGMISDLGGFCAGTYMRGIRFINIPTTLLSQVDAAIGGKTGIDFHGRKNMIGLFVHPESVFVYTVFLKTLPTNEFKSGYAELLKHGLIRDKSLWAKLINRDIYEIEGIETLVYQSINIKNQITDSDPKESGLRKILNFGHTIGHAIEAHWLETNSPLLHGEAIAIGMVAEAFIAYRMDMIDESALFEVRRAILRIYGHHPRYVKPVHNLLAIMRSDKKNIGEQLRFALLDDIGSCSYDINVPDVFIEEGLIFYSTILKHSEVLSYAT